MRNLFAFLLRYNLVLLFIILMGAGIGMYFSHNSYQRSILLQSTTAFTGGVNDMGNTITQYFNLREANIRLAEENAQLRALIEMKQDTLPEYTFPDSITEGQYKYIPAQVISNTVNKKYNYMMLDKGREEGIKPDQGVISSKGVVGIITHVSSHYSSALSLVNLNTQISACLKGTEEIGRISWDGSDYSYSNLLDIPTHISVIKGDTVLTSGYSHIFPRDLAIGIVDSVSYQTGDHFYNIRIRLAENFNGLYHVYVIENSAIDSLLHLEKQNERTSR